MPRTRLLMLNLLMGLFLSAHSQSITQTQGSREEGEIQSDSLQSGSQVSDTGQIRYFMIYDPERIRIFSDTALNNHLHQYSPTRKRDDEYVGLGYIGSAARPILRQSSDRMGFDLGFHQFDVYFFRTRDFRFFTGKRAFSQGKWTFRSMGNDSNLDFEYGGHFRKNLFLSLNWNRTNSSATGDYKLINQSALNSCWGAALMQKGMQYHWSLGFSSNDFQQNDNGGLLNDAALRKSDTLLIGGRQSIPSRFSQAMALGFTSRNIEWRYGRELVGTADGSRKLQLIHQANLIFDRYKSSARFSGRTALQESNDSLFLGNLLSDSRGVRLFIQSQALENRLSLCRNVGSTSSVINQFEAGIIHRFVNVSDEKQLEKLQNTFAFARFDLESSNRIRLNSALQLGLLPENAGEYKAEGNIQFSIRPQGTLEVKLVQQRFQPTLLQRRMVNAQREIWNNDFQKTTETTLTSAWHLKKIGFRAVAGFQLLNNYIYFNQQFLPQQVKTAISVFQLTLNESFRIKHFGSEHYLAIQRSTDSRIHLPLLSGKHSIFAEGSLFRKKSMLARIGVDLRYASAYLADGYQPLIGQFYWQENNILPFFPSADVFISAKVKSSRLFVKVENLNRSWDKRTIFYQTPFYPQYDTYVRIGMQRIFTD